MSFSALRRAVPTRAAIVASTVLALGGTLALASSASATQIQAGASTDAAYCGSGVASSLWPIDNAENNALYNAAALLNGSTIYPNTVTLAELSANSVDPTVVATIGADFMASANEATLVGTIEEADGVTQAQAQGIYNELSGAMTGAVAAYGQIPGLIGLATYDAKDYPNGLYTVDGDVAISSKASVKATGNAAANLKKQAVAANYSLTVGTTSAAAKGYVLPAAFSVTFPADYGLNVALIPKEIATKQEASPPAADAIGTVSITSPAVEGEDLGTTDKLTGKIYVVAFPSATDPSLELSFDPGIYNIGTFSGIDFPITVSFGETHVGAGTDPLPFSSLSLSFPAAKAPLLAKSCSDLGTTGASATDEVATLAPLFGDVTDGFTGTDVSPVVLPATATSVTDLCGPSASSVSVSGVKKGKPAVKATITGNGGTAFTALTVALPSGVSAKGLKASDLKSSVKIKSIKVKGQDVTVTFASATKKVALSYKAGLKATAKVAKAKSLSFKVTAKTKAGATGATSFSGKVKS